MPIPKAYSFPIRSAAVLVLLVLVACSSETLTHSLATATKPQTTEIQPFKSETLTQTTECLATATVALGSPEPPPFPLTDPGPYQSGKRTYQFLDANRKDRPVSITVWYPVLRLPGSNSRFARHGAEPDFSGAPYPLILSSTKVARIFAPYLVSHGFTWVSVDKIDTYYRMNEQMYQQPLDILFALEQVASHPPGGLEGMIDTEHAGAIGYSFDGYNTLAMSGARIDPEYYLAQCPTPDATTESILSPLSSYNCGPAREWDEFSAQAGEDITTSENGMWQPMTDARIRAVMPLAPEGWWLFGERGLESVDKPTLMIVSTNDDLYPEDLLIFEHLGTPDKSLISFVGQDHMMVYKGEMVARMAHFAAAFFGYHLQGREDYSEYFSKEFVGQHDDLAWGVYQDE